MMNPYTGFSEDCGVFFRRGFEVSLGDTRGGLRMTPITYLLAQADNDVLVVFWIFYVGVLVLTIAGMWAVFVKAGQPGWAVIVPIFNLYVLCKVAGKPGWWVILCLLPIINLVITAIVAIDLAKAFGKGTGFGMGLWLLSPIYYPILGFGSAQYQGPIQR